MNILIPLGGTGNRFAVDGYKRPKPLIHVLGKPLIYWIISSLNLSSEDKIFIGYNSYLEPFNFEDIVRYSFPNIDISFVSIPYQTQGASETVLYTMNHLNIPDGEILVMDGDTFYKDDVIGLYRSSDNKNAIFYFEDKSQESHFSFITIENGKIISIKEKERISGNACSGGYGFSSIELLKRYCEKIISKKFQLEKESYISMLYGKMLIDDIPISSILVKDVYCLGTPSQLRCFCLAKSDLTGQRICFDLDNTLVSYPKKPGDYTTVEPIEKTIQMLRHMKHNGATIIINTARKMKTAHGDPVLAKELAMQQVQKTLGDMDIPYDELYFGKPYAHFYIDDLSINPYTSDVEKTTGIYLGAVEPRDKHKIVYGETVKKISKNGDLGGELHYYRNIPESLLHLFPKFYNGDENSIEIEFLDGISISSLYANCCMTPNQMLSILEQVNMLHNTKVEPEAIDIYANYATKLANRYAGYDYSIFPDSKDLFQYLHGNLVNYEKSNGGILSVIHGDAVLTNIILSNGQYKFIDMRGKCGDVNTICGDIFYDYAKILQSLVGYDCILHGYKENTLYANSMIAEFKKYF